ncbi:unnamed protein product [Fraxinus pennsylvanica]|uniref:Uncharacterized protein n=1 Tax=Fraxinus pennsylvanica TaxID=56036 RepID=A0AAD2A0M4_9LAMI|nr:unnamed protein product [Fraxinus pennsylvanica]
MIATLVGMSQGMTLLLAKFPLLFEYERAYYNEYAVGFSGVLFSMKVVLYSQSDNYTYVQGIMVPSRYAAWAELILIQMFVSSVSFLCHQPKPLVIKAKSRTRREDNNANQSSIG